MGLKELEGSGRDDSFRCDFPEGDWGVRLKFGTTLVSTPGYRRIKEADEQRKAAEGKRALYVAMTRAERLLVVSFFRKVTRNRKGDIRDGLGDSILGEAAWVLGDGDRLDPSLVAYLTGDVSEPLASHETPSGLRDEARGGDLGSSLAALDQRREVLRAGSARPLRRAGEHELEANPEDAPAFEREPATGDRALRIGIAVHAAMERLLDPLQPTGIRLDERAVGATLEAAGAGLANDKERAEVRRLVERLIGDPCVSRALVARRRFVELPILFRDGAGPESPLIEGKIDLLFEEDDGLVLVDWKTDRVDTPTLLAERTALYQSQLDAYARGLEAALGPKARVKERLLVFARAG
jgi:ATP-dependent helicase/nuclease subunit A